MRDATEVTDSDYVSIMKCLVSNHKIVTRGRFMGGRLSIQVASRDLQNLQARADRWGDVLDKQLRDQLRNAATRGSRRAKANVLRAQFPGVPRGRGMQRSGSTGLREALAASVKVRVAQQGLGSVDYRITSAHPLASTTNLPPGGRPVFRHPLFGDRGSGKWFSQRRSPWWSGAMADSKPDMEKAASDALAEALRRF